MTRDFQLKFIDVMLGVILGLGFQWWPNLNGWQYLAFIFAYLNLVDYWIDYSPTVKKFPLNHELDAMLHTLIIFAMFFLVYTTQKSIDYFLGAFILYRCADLLWLWRIKTEHTLNPHDAKFINAWNFFDLVEVFFTVALFLLARYTSVGPLTILVIFIILRLFTRVLASMKYHKVYFV